MKKIEESLIKDVQLCSELELGFEITKLASINTDSNYKNLIEKLDIYKERQHEELYNALKDVDIALFIVENKFSEEIKNYAKKLGLSETVNLCFVELITLESEILNLKNYNKKFTPLDFVQIFRVINAYLNLKLFIQVINDLNQTIKDSESTTFFIYIINKIKRAAKRGSFGDSIVLLILLARFRDFFGLELNRKTLSHLAGNKIESLILPMLFNCFYENNSLNTYKKVELLFPLFKIIVPEIKLKLEIDLEKNIRDNFYLKFFRNNS